LLGTLRKQKYALAMKHLEEDFLSDFFKDTKKMSYVVKEFPREVAFRFGVSSKMFVFKF